MSRPRPLLTIAVLQILTLAAVAQEKPDAKPADAPPAAVAASNLSFSGPFSHEGLTVFVVHGSDAVGGSRFLTLQEGLESKKVRVIETGEVSELQIENLSDEEIYIESGEIVRGGKQDRLLAVDLILEPKSGKVPIQSFCVESGRWAQRGDESGWMFSSSAKQTPDNSIKLAAKRAKSQEGVWSGVAGAQAKLGRNVGENVADRKSATSLELTLDNEKVKQKAAEYSRALLPLIDGKPDAIGMVVALNGKPYSADLYGSRDLFAKMRSKLLDAAAVAAVSTLDEKKAAQPPTPDSARAFLLSAAAEPGRKEPVSKRVFMTLRETATTSLFETFDTKSGGWVHINCLAREAADNSKPAPSVEVQKQNRP